jgi:hypothetical protein
MYKLTRTLDGKISALSFNIINGQYTFAPVNSEKVLRLTWEEAKQWKEHLEEVRRFVDGSIRARCPGVIQIVSFDMEYRDKL